MKLESSYDTDTWEQTVWIDGKRFVYTDVSPYHNSEFTKRAEKNKGRAIAFIKGFKRKKGE